MTEQLPPPGVLVPAAGAAAQRPFRAVGHIELTGQPPFAQPLLILDDGTVYQLTGPERAACIRLRGRRLDLGGTVIGTSTAPGVRGVVEVTSVQEVGP